MRPVVRTRAVLEGVATTEGQVAVSVALVLAAIAVSFVLAPFLARRIATAFRWRVEASAADSTLERLDTVLGWTIPVAGVVRTIQTAVVVATALSLLVVWGYMEWALLALDVLHAAWPYAVRILLTFVLVGAAVVGSRYLEHSIEEWAADATYVTQHQEGVAFRILQISLFVAVGMGALSLWNIDLSGLLIGAGFLGIVVGMASRQTLGSLVAGFVLMFSRPFEIGDWVEIDDNEGIVTDITIVNTRLRNFDGETVVLPNDRVASSTVINRSNRNRLRIRVEVGIDYGTDVERARQIALEAVETVEEVSPAPKPDVIPKSFADSSIVLECRFWIKRPNARKKWKTQAAVIRAVKEAFEREGIKIPFPQRELSGRAETGGFRVADEQRATDPRVTGPEE